MSEIAFQMNHVYKKFRKGEIYDSLRDLIPALAGKLWRREQENELKKSEFWALRDISFEVKKGEALGIIGPNGAGKSTILKLLCGILKPTRGFMDVRGRLSALIEVGAGFHQDLTGRENIYLNGTILGMKRAEIARKLEEIIDFSGLGDFIDTPVKRYSSGMYARLGFSVAAHVDPDIFIIDEVLSVGDYLFQRKCVEKMTSIIKGGATVIFVSHNLKAVAELCSRAILLDRGKIVKEGKTNEVIENYMHLGLGEDAQKEGKNVFISGVNVRGQEGKRLNFQSGDTIWLDIQVSATSRCEKLAIVVDVKDENFYHCFDTSTERLGYGTFSLKPGENFNCTFELELNLASGTFHFVVTVYRYDIQKAYDSVFPAATIYVSAVRDIRGIVNLNPKVIKQEIVGEGAEESCRFMLQKTAS